ncbi:MAG: zinc ABC transporter substrate-binding protein [Gammaproteobacteria bacterium]|nr:zinc ABC transporter substrate-binding protein [Gammaproteobacteria bacterium]
MRKLSIALTLAAAAFAAPGQAALKVFACEPEWGVLATALGGDAVEVYAATTALQDVHRIQARPSLIAKYRQADLLVCTGADLEIGWLPALAEKGNNPKLLPGAPGYFEAARHVTMLEVPASVDRALGDVHPQGNPHIQTSARNIAAVAAPLAERLAQLDPPHAADYRARHRDFAARWAEAMLRWEERAQPLRGVPVVSNHKSWAYLYDWLGLREIATLEPKPGIPPSAAHLEAVLTGLGAQPARMVVYAAYQDRRPAEWLAGRAGIPAVELPYSVGGVPGTDDLFALFDATVDRLLAALGGKAG